MALCFRSVALLSRYTPKGTTSSWPCLCDKMVSRYNGCSSYTATLRFPDVRLSQLRRDLCRNPMGNQGRTTFRSAHKISVSNACWSRGAFAVCVSLLSREPVDFCWANGVGRRLDGTDLTRCYADVNPVKVCRVPLKTPDCKGVSQDACDTLTVRRNSMTLLKIQTRKCAINDFWRKESVGRFG